jgi:hypothetical protein
MRKTWMDQVRNQQDNGASAELVLDRALCY